jgi:hypothetical protein
MYTSYIYMCLLECPKLEEARHDNLYNIENKYKNFKSLANVSKCIWLMSAEDTFIYRHPLQIIFLNKSIFKVSICT